MKGLDLCYHQGDIDWQQVRASGIDFIIPRDGWGMDDIDPKLVTNSKEAIASGISVQGVYHFIYGINVSEAIKNADRAIANVKAAGLPKSTVIWCDIEQDTIDNARDYRGVNLTNKDLTAMAKAFCNRCLAEGYCTGIYLNADYLVNRYGQDIMYEYDIWFADPSGAYNYPCLIKQIDWYGRIGGISVNVDVDEWIGTYTAGTAKPQKGDDKPMGIVYTEKELVDILIKLGKGNPPSDYNNSPPYNLLYWSGSRWSADCSNLYKALFNGRSIVNPKPGSFQDDLRNTGDCTGRQLMDQCTQRSNNFKALGNQFRCLYWDDGKDWHFGGYLGKEIEIPGQGIINVVEATPRWEGGIQYSYVDENGGRSWAKGRPIDGGYWIEHGLATKWIDYSGSQPQPQPTPTPTPAQKPHLTVSQFIPYLGYVAKGKKGDMVLMLQNIMKDLGYYDGYLDGDCGDYTVRAIKAMQTDLGVTVDGSCGTQTFSALIY